MAVTRSPNLVPVIIIILGVGWANNFNLVRAQDSETGTDPIMNVLHEIISNQKVLQEKIETIENPKSKDDIQKLRQDVRFLKEIFLRAMECKRNENSGYSLPLGRARECSEFYHNGWTRSGIYIIFPHGNYDGERVNVYCDLSDGESGWTVIVSRQPSEEQVNFQRNWTDYKNGFGNPEDEYWIGNDVLHQLTGFQPHVLRVDLEDWDGKQTYAQYESFLVEDEAHNYRLHVGGYSGDAGDALDYHNYQEFSTIDRDNDRWCDGSCSERYKSGFWHNGWPDVCFHASPTNPLLPIRSSDINRYGIIYNNDVTKTYRKMSMKIKPSNFCKG